jgi:autotransporter-associated beta strand protein
LTVTGAGSGSGTTFAGAISNASAAGYGNLTISGGALTLSGSNTFTGTTLVSGGTLTIGNTYALQDSTVNPAGGTLSFTQPTATFGALTGSGNLSAGTVALTIGGIGSTNIYSGSLTGSGGLTTVNATGVETLTNYNNTGNLAVGAGGAAAAADSLTISGGTFGSSASTLGIESSTEGTTFDMSGGTATFGTVNIAINSGNTGSGMTISGGTAVFTTTNLGSGGNTGGNLIISGSSTNVALGAYTDNRDENGGLEIEGGTVTATSLAMLGAGNSHGVNTTISGGSLTIGNSSSTGAFEIASGGAVTEDLNVSGGSLTYLGADGLLLNIGAFPTAVSLTGGVTSLTGITLDDVNSATVGSTLVVNDGATLYLGSVGLNEGSTPTVDSGASVTLATGTIGALANWSTSVPIVLTTGSTTTFQAADANSVAHDITLNGAISGGGTMAKTGAGVELLSANNSYTGATVVNGGTLEVSGAISGTASVSVNNATLELAAGNALNSVAPITLQSGVLQVLASQSEALGTLALNGGASTLSLGTSGDVINFADSSALAWTGTLAISDWNGASAGGGSDEVFFGATNDLTHAQLADITFTDGSVDGNSFVTDSAVQLADGELVAAAIPEPGAWAMMLAGAGMLCVWQRTRRRARNGRALDSGARSA